MINCDQCTNVMNTLLFDWSGVKIKGKGTAPEEGRRSMVKRKDEERRDREKMEEDKSEEDRD